MYRKSKLFPLTATAVMIAMSVILCRYLGFSPQDTMVRFEIGFVPIALVAYLFGPVYSTVAYVLSDVIGSLLSGYAPNLWITAAQALFGLIMGLFFYKKKPTVLRVSLVFLLISVVVEILFKAPIFIYMFGYTPGLAFGVRALNAAANYPVRVILFYVLARVLEKPLNKLIKNVEGNKINEKEGRHPS